MTSHQSSMKEQKHRPFSDVAFSHLVCRRHVFPEQQLNISLVVFGCDRKEAVYHKLDKGHQLL